MTAASNDTIQQILDALAAVNERFLQIASEDDPMSDEYHSICGDAEVVIELLLHTASPLYPDLVDPGECRTFLSTVVKSSPRYLEQISSVEGSSWTELRRNDKVIAHLQRLYQAIKDQGLAASFNGIRRFSKS